MAVEPLEPRLLLSADLFPGAESALLSGFQDFSDLLAQLDADEALAQPLPFINRSLSDYFEVDGVLQSNSRRRPDGYR